MTSLQAAYIRRVADQNPLVAALLLAIVTGGEFHAQLVPIASEHGVGYAVLLGVAWDTWAELSRIPQV